jgi:electron transfer flavoprotein beta subunit
VEIIVCIKQIYDLAQIKVDPSSKNPVTEGVARKLGDFDKNALEEAIRIKEKHGGNVYAVIKGMKDAAKEALAMGADEAIFYNADTESLGTANILAEIIRKMKYDLILCGEASIDEYSFQTGPRLAQALGIPVLTYARKIELRDGGVVVERDLEKTFEVAIAKLPALVTVTKEINEPRIPTLMQILGSSKKKITETSPSKPDAGVETLSILAIEMKRKEVILKDVEALAKVIITEK